MLCEYNIRKGLLKVYGKIVDETEKERNRFWRIL